MGLDIYAYATSWKWHRKLRRDFCFDRIHCFSPEEEGFYWRSRYDLLDFLYCNYDKGKGKQSPGSCNWSVWTPNSEYDFCHKPVNITRKRLRQLKKFFTRQHWRSNRASEWARNTVWDTPRFWRNYSLEFCKWASSELAKGRKVYLIASW